MRERVLRAIGESTRSIEIGDALVAICDDEELIVNEGLGKGLSKN